MRQNSDNRAASCSADWLVRLGVLTPVFLYSGIVSGARHPPAARRILMLACAHEAAGFYRPFRRGTGLAAGGACAAEVDAGHWLPSQRIAARGGHESGRAPPGSARGGLC